MEQVGEKVRQIATLLQESGRTVVLTGAGVSTESGIPDFRSPGSGLWTRVAPELFTIQGFKADPAQFYNLGKEFFYLIRAAAPNETHLVLGELQKRGLVKTIITQNVDGLHQKGGAVHVLEIHGSLRTASCIFCRRRVSMELVIADLEEGLIPPLCVECGEPVKPDVILFGEPMPASYREALAEAGSADCIMVIGSSMQVSPANLLPGLIDNLVIINRERTFYDDRARVVIHGATSETMSLIFEQVNACG
ncbi:MAG: Sir2 family NAD-dependent protein deacetylase [Bacillota bacterium]